jgi:hypothetical protein
VVEPFAISFPMLTLYANLVKKAPSASTLHLSSKKRFMSVRPASFQRVDPEPVGRYAFDLLCFVSEANFCFGDG